MKRRRLSDSSPQHMSLKERGVRDYMHDIVEIIKLRAGGDFEDIEYAKWTDEAIKVFAEFLKNNGSYDKAKCSQLVPQEVEALNIWFSAWYAIFLMIGQESKFNEMTKDIALPVHCGIKRNVSVKDTGDIAKIGGSAAVAGGITYAASKNIGLSLLGAIVGGGGFAYYLNKKYGNTIKNWDYLKGCPDLQKEVIQVATKNRLNGHIK